MRKEDIPTLGQEVLIKNQIDGAIYKLANIARDAIVSALRREWDYSKLIELHKQIDNLTKE